VPKRLPLSKDPTLFSQTPGSGGKGGGLKESPVPGLPRDPVTGGGDPDGGESFFERSFDNCLLKWRLMLGRFRNLRPDPSLPREGHGRVSTEHIYS